MVRSVETCVERATAELVARGHDAARVRAVGVASQRETLVVWDRATGEPLRAAGPPVHVTDSTNASRSMLVGIRTLDYDDGLLSFFGLDRARLALPEVVPSSHPTAFGALAGGPLRGVRIAGCLGDGSAGLVGQRALGPGQAASTYGAGCSLLCVVGPEPVFSGAGLRATVAYDLGRGEGPVYALEGSVAAAGSAVSLLLNNLGLVGSPESVDDVALSVPDNGGVYFVTAFGGLSAPYCIDYAQGTLCESRLPPTFTPTPPARPRACPGGPPPDHGPLTRPASPVGMTAHTQRGHVARATLEATCHQTAAVLDAMAADSGRAPASLAVDGGLAASDLCMQTQADLAGLPVRRPAARETTALGAAMAAGLAVDDLRRLAPSPAAAVFRPRLGPAPRAAMRRRWERTVDMSRGWLRDRD